MTRQPWGSGSAFTPCLRGALSLPRAAAPAQVPGAAALPSSPQPWQELLLPLAMLLSKSLWNAPCGESISQHLPQQPSGQCWCCPGGLVAPEPCSGEGGTRWHCPREVWGLLLCRCCNPAGNARAKPSWRAGEGLLESHPLQALLLKELIWTRLLCVPLCVQGSQSWG